MRTPKLFASTFQEDPAEAQTVRFKNTYSRSDTFADEDTGSGKNRQGNGRPIAGISPDPCTDDASEAIKD